ncbi:carbamate kinase 1 [Clostridiales bacterium]|nr:carbamate kinase 1 [Clostridiales bacterium]
MRGVGAVIDKDFASCLMAKEIDADYLIILTAVENVSINFNKPDEKKLCEVTTDEMRQYSEEGHFAKGSMLPKVEAAIDFADSREGRIAIITHLDKAREGINGETGTRIKKSN